MSNVVPIPDQGKHHVEASDWVSRIDAGLTKLEESEFNDWLKADDANRDAFIYLAHLWDDMDGLSKLAEMFPDEEHVEPRSYARSFSIAASTVFALIAVSLFVGRGVLFNQAAVENSYETSVGEHSSVSLPDGSLLIINTNSLVKVSYKEDYRLVTLERGEIHIDVAHDESRALSVKAGDKVIQAVGTAFNVQLLEDKKFELIVTDGKVRVGDRVIFERNLARKPSKRKDLNRIVKPLKPLRLAEDSLSISKGERIVIGVKEVIDLKELYVDSEKIQEVEIKSVLSWREGNLAFNGESLEYAISEISRYTTTEFEFENEGLKDVRIAGLFKSGDVNGLLLALEDSFEIYSTKIEEDKYRLYRDL